MTIHELSRRLSVAGGGRPARFHHEPRSHTVTETPARDALIRYATTTRTVTVDGLDPLLDAVIAEAAASSAVPAPATDRAAERRDRYAAPLFALMRQNGWDGERTEPVVREMDLVLDAVLAVADAEQSELRRERDLAIAHDRQPYPTAWAYEQACKTLHRKTEAIERVLTFAASLDETGRQIAGPDAVHPVAAHIRHLLDTTDDGDAASAVLPASLDRAVSELRRMADETPQPETERTPCSDPPCDNGPGEPCDRHETEQAHADGLHEDCGVTCGVQFPSEQLRNFVVAKGYPGTAGMLDELLRRAASGQLPAAPAVVAQPDGEAQS
jgi:hypothetical protein